MDYRLIRIKHTAQRFLSEEFRKSTFYVSEVHCTVLKEANPVTLNCSVAGTKAIIKESAASRFCSKSLIYLGRQRTD